MMNRCRSFRILPERFRGGLADRDLEFDWQLQTPLSLLHTSVPLATLLDYLEVNSSVLSELRPETIFIDRGVHATQKQGLTRCKTKFCFRQKFRPISGMEPCSKLVETSYKKQVVAAISNVYLWQVAARDT